MRGNPDPALDVVVPDGMEEITVAVRDVLGRGGVGFPYRLTVEPGGPDFHLTLGPRQGFPTREGHWFKMDRFDTLSLPAGRATKFRVTARRSAKEHDPHYRGPVQGFSGPIRISADDLPAGVHVAPVVTATGEAEAELVFTTTDASKRLSENGV